MPESDYWRLYAFTMWTLLGDTNDDGVAYLAMLHTAGYFAPRSGVPRPAFMDPVKKASSDFRLRYVAPFQVQGPPKPEKREDAGLPAPWWTEAEAAFWMRVENRFVVLRGGEWARASVRTPAGKWMLTKLRKMRPGCETDPEVLARALHEWGSETDAAS